MKKIELTKNIMKKIKEERINMRPKSYFVALSFTQKFLLITSFTAALFFINLTIFKFRIYDPFGFLVFGEKGVEALIGLIPVFILMFVLVSIIGLSFVIRFFDFSYKINYASVVAVMFFMILSGGFMIDRTGINETVKKANSFPLLYFGRYTTDKWIMGEIKSLDIKNKSLVLTIPYDQGERKIMWDDKTVFPNYEKIEVGVYVKVIGNQEKDHFGATGIAQSEFPIRH